jgi:hypothetical protein
VDKVGKVGAAVLVALLFIALGEGLTIQKIGIGPISIDFSSGDTTTKPPDPGPSSSGPDRPAVPNLAGRNRQAADAALTAAGLTADFVAVDNDAPADQVVSTSPNAGTKVDAHSTVRVEISRGPFVGTWVNVDAKTRSIPQVTVDTASGTSMTLHVWGACTPTWCDWGTAAATLVGTELRATYNQGFATKDVRLTRTGSQLVVKSHTHFTDSSGRADYDSTDTMSRK